MCSLNYNSSQLKKKGWPKIYKILHLDLCLIVEATTVAWHSVSVPKGCEHKLQAHDILAKV